MKKDISNMTLSIQESAEKRRQAKEKKDEDETQKNKTLQEGFVTALCSLTELAEELRASPLFSTPKDPPYKIRNVAVISDSPDKNGRNAELSYSGEAVMLFFNSFRFSVCRGVPTRPDSTPGLFWMAFGVTDGPSTYNLELGPEYLLRDRGGVLHPPRGSQGELAEEIRAAALRCIGQYFGAGKDE